MPRQEETYNRQNWAYKNIGLVSGASSGTGGIFATCNAGPVAVLPGIAGTQVLGGDCRVAIPTTLVQCPGFARDRATRAGGARPQGREPQANAPIPLTDDIPARIYSAS